MVKIKLLSLLLTTSMLFTFTGCSLNSKETISKSSETEISAAKKNDSSYELKCEVLKNPDAIIEAADKSAAFWIGAYDSEYGGFFANVFNDGKVDPDVTYKVSTIQARNAYGLAKAYQLTGKKEYLDYARKSIDFLYENAWDEKNGGWYSEMNQDGTLVNEPIQEMPWNNFKWVPNQMCMISGISGMYETTRSNTDKEWMEKTIAIIDEKMWDSRPGYEGYYEMSGEDWSNPTNKTLFPVEAYIAAIAENTYRIFPNKNYKDRMLVVADMLINYFVKSMDEREFGMNDIFDNDWNPLDAQPSTYSGNFLKSAWCLTKTYLANPKAEYKEGAKKLIDEILYSNAYDKENGGPFASLDPKTGISTDRKKSWWVHESAVLSGLTYYYISNDTEYLKMADESMDFFMQHMYDPEYGEAFKATDEYGLNLDSLKGDYWSDSFHTLELFYYTYLYGNLMLHNNPVTLYYYIDADTQKRDIILQPISLGDTKLIIESVTLDGKKFKDFDSLNAQLKLSPNVGGEFKVTFRAKPEKQAVN